MTGTDLYVKKPHLSRSYLNHLVYSDLNCLKGKNMHVNQQICNWLKILFSHLRVCCAGNVQQQIYRYRSINTGFCAYVVKLYDELRLAVFKELE
jgi:hypothetical protein